MKRWINTIGIELIWIIVFATFKAFTVQYRIPGIIGPLSDGLFVIGLLYLIVGLVIAFANMLNCYAARFVIYCIMIKLKFWSVPEGEEQMGYIEFCDITSANEKRQTFMAFKWRMVLIGIASIVMSFALVSLLYKV